LLQSGLPTQTYIQKNKFKNEVKSNVFL